MALIERVEAYAKAHRTVIFTGTTQGLYLHRDVTRCQRFFVRLVLVPAADSSAKASVSYTLEDASLLPMDHARWSFVKEQYDMLRAAFDRSGGVGGVGFFVALFVDQSTGAEFLDPISFDQAGVDYLTDGWLWRGQIYKDLNHVRSRPCPQRWQNRGTFGNPIALGVEYLSQDELMATGSIRGDR